MEHIAILSHKSILEKILAGQKTIESRFSRLKSLPYGQIRAGDHIFFKLSGGLILGEADAIRVEEFEDLTPDQITEVARRYEKELAISSDFLARKLESKFATLIFLTEVKECIPWNYKQDGRSGWIVLPPGIKLPNSDIETAPELDFRSIGLLH